MKRRLSVAVLTLALITAFMPLTAFAENEPDHDVYWNCTESTLLLGHTYESVGFDEEPDDEFKFTEEEQSGGLPPWIVTENFTYSAVRICDTISPVSTTAWFSNEDNNGRKFDALRSIALTGLDSSSVTDMSNMFYGSPVRTISFGSSFYTSNVTDMSYMFDGCTFLKSLDLSGFNTSKVERMDYMFDNCTAVKSLDLSGFDTSAVTDMSYMFNYCSAARSIDLTDFDTSSVKTMENMFAYCTALRSLDLSSFDTSSVENMYQMFYSCYALSDLDISGFDVSHVDSGDKLFSSCYALETIYTGCTQDWGSYEGIDDFSELFDDCKALEGGEGTDYSDYLESSGLELVRVDGLDGKPGLFTAKHKWTETSSIPATPSKEGSRSYKCKVCGETKTELIPKLADKWANTLSVKTKAVNIKAKKLKKKAQTIKAVKAYVISDAQGPVSFSKISIGSKSINKKYGRKFTVNTVTGIIKVKKGVPKGTYNLKVKVSAKGNPDYLPADMTVTVKVRIK